MRRIALFVSISALALALLPTGPVQAAGRADPDVIPGSYIVVLKSGAPGSVSAEHSRRHNASVQYVYRHALRGYAARMSDRAAANIARDPRVAYVDEDRIVTTAHHQCGHDKPTPFTGDCQPTEPAPEPQAGALSGMVTSGGSGLAGATVTLTVDGVIYTGETGTDGGYTIAGVPPGEHQVMASKSGYVSETKSVTIDGDQTLDFTLAPEPQAGALSGMVTSGGSGLAGATVTLTVDGVIYTGETGTDGGYTIAGVPPGEHQVMASKSGYVSETKSVTIDGDQTLDFALAAETTSTKQPIPWGVARVGAPLANTAAGIHVYVIDTGIDPRHRDLNVADGFAVETCKGGGCAAAWDDDHGHGTHVAGTIGAEDNDVDVVGVAPDVTLHAVKVLSKNGMGSRSGVVAGIDWVAGHNSGQPRVANMSLGGSGSKTGSCTSGGFSGSDSYHRAICNATRSGVVFAVAAGNSGANAAGAVPAAYHDTVITVSATSSASDWPSWSNWGTGSEPGIPTASAPVGIAAPGVSISSTRAGGGTTTMSGTSMAAPHVAGAVAVFLASNAQQNNYSAFSNARADLLGSRAQVTSSANGWKNSSGNSHVESFLQVLGL